MKLPRYIKLKTKFKNGHLNAIIQLKKWGYPFLIFKTLKESHKLKWYQWLMYPYICLKIMVVKA
jgi:hypothetical protein